MTKPTFDEALLRRMAHEVRTQDNRMTSDPVFCVQVEGPLSNDDDGDYVWQTEQTFFTRNAAEAYILNPPTVGPIRRIYVETGCHNPEWKAVRELLRALFPAEGVTHSEDPPRQR